MYVSGASVVEICQVTGLHKQQLYRLLARCKSLDQHNIQLRWRGCDANFKPPRDPADTIVSEKTISNHFHSAKNALTGLFHRHPQLKENVDNATLNGKFNKKDEPRPLKQYEIFQKFIRLCSRLGLAKEKKYPFNCVDEGEEALRSYCKQVKNRHPKEVELNEGSELQTDHLRFEYHTPFNTTPLPLDRLELDGFKLDAQMVYEYLHPKYKTINSHDIEGLTLVAIVEPIFGAILGYSISHGLSYGISDVMRAAKSMYQWKPIKFEKLDFEYPADGGLPCGRIELFKNIGFLTIALDSALQHISERIRRVVFERVAFFFEFGRKGDKNRRAAIENLFAQFAAKAFRQIVSGTSKNARNEPKRNAKALAAKYVVSDELIIEVVEAVIATWNAACPPGSMVSRMQSLREYVYSPNSVVMTMPDAVAQRDWYDDIKDDAKIVRTKGRRPFVKYKGVRYRNKNLNDFGLLNKEVTLFIDSDRIQSIRAVLNENGRDLGMLLSEKSWRTPHSARTRKSIQRVKAHGPKISDVVENLNEQLLTQHELTVRDATVAARSNAERKRASKEESAEKIPVNEEDSFEESTDAESEHSLDDIDPIFLNEEEDDFSDIGTFSRKRL